MTSPINPMAMASAGAPSPQGAGARPGAPAVPAGRRADKERFQWGSLALLAPSLALLVVLFIIPVVYAFYLGFTNLQLVGPNAVDWHFTGTANLHQLVSDQVFSYSVWLTLIFILGSVAGVVLIGLALAMLLQTALAPLRILAGGIVIIAWMMPAITAGMTWYASTVNRF